MSSKKPLAVNQLKKLQIDNFAYELWVLKELTEQLALRLAICLGERMQQIFWAGCIAECHRAATDGR